jgi:hypothetical protein
MPQTIFEIHDELKRVPFVVQKHYGTNRYAIVICSIQNDSKGMYARGYPMNFNPLTMSYTYSNHFEDYDSWRKYMIVPAANKEEWISIPYELFSDKVLMDVYFKLKEKADNERSKQKKYEQR